MATAGGVRYANPAVRPPCNDAESGSHRRPLSVGPRLSVQEFRTLSRGRLPV